MEDQGADAVLNLQPNSSIPLSYHSSFGPHDDLILLEVDSALLPQFLHNHITIRGHPDEDAVLCTTSSTFALKSVSNSNTLFLIPPTSSQDNLAASASVLKISPGNLELMHIAPKLDKLRSLLAHNPYRPDSEGGDQAQLYSWADLASRIQASDEELKSGLRAISAVEIEGYWRIVDEDLMGEVLAMLLHESVLNDWSLKALEGDGVVAALEADGFPRAAVIHCLEMLGNSESGGGVWSLDERRVCSHFARRILQKGKMKMERFMEEWERSIPEGMLASFEMLEGEVLVDRIGMESWVRKFSVSDLPWAPAERFAALFRERQKWEWKDLEPYIRFVDSSYS